MKHLDGLNIYDYAVISKLHQLGPKTKMQLLSLGLKGFMIENLYKYGILVREQDPTTNLYVYRVKDELISKPGKS